MISSKCRKEAIKEKQNWEVGDKIYALRLNITNSETWKALEMGTRVENKFIVP